ncbi:transglycosylase domain-containing protein [Tateyamaria omphalii]|uniref:transglycosylase domain-containing protein n=1 Tax=Tateyamaria omphalii TaxID=299262 RepID=UPI001C999C1A|nr:transglycosylase domain-containing protein [Tateyamaria omphalii]MBY5935408.1 transglycosylase domain-containing protein [Tateyamaria omphalii]
MSDSRKGKRPLVADRRYPKKKTAKPAARKAPVKKRRKAPVRKPSRNIFVRLFRWILRLVWWVTWRVGLTVTAAIALAVGYFWTTLPDVNALLDGRARGSVTLLDREGNRFAWRGDQFGGAVMASTVAPGLKDAVVATEDKRFYRHFGVSPRGIASAVRINLREGRGPLQGHGGSTITQQTAKLLCLGVVYDPAEWESEAAYVADCRRGSLQRKAKEAIYAMAMEAKYSKEEILSIYLNRAYMGAGAYGAEAAAQRYFGKPAAMLTPSEGAMIAGLLTAPSRLAPTSDLQRSQDRAATVLRLMGEQGYLSDAEVAKWQNNPANLSPAARRKAGGYFADWVMSTGPEFFTRDTTEDVIIRTTLDQRLQSAAEDALKEVFETKVREGSKAQAAIVVMSADGAVRAMVGGRETRVAGVFNRAIQAQRQTGSAFKPFVYAAALELGYSPLDFVDDEPLTLDIPGSGRWSPRNYTNTYSGRVTLTKALADSLNIPAVKVSESMGRDLVRRVATDFGITGDMADGPALALGASESTLLDMTGAYAGILNGGSSVTPYGLVDLRLQGDDVPLMGTGGGIGERVVQEGAARELIWMMEKVVSEGTGQRAQFGGWQIAGKTGTTQAARDAWFIGFTADYVTGVWMGYDDNTPLTGVTGGGLPTEIWRETMLRVHEGTSPRPLPLQVPERALRQAQQTEPAPQQRQPEVPRTTEGLIETILRDILGGGRSQ